MPVVINEVEILQPEATEPAQAPGTSTAAPTAPAEDLRRWLQDAAWRAHRLVAD